MLDLLDVVVMCSVVGPALNDRKYSGAFSILQDHAGCFFSHHDDRCAGITGWNLRHRRGIDNAQSRDTFDSQTMIHHTMIIRSHAACANRVIHRLRLITDVGLIITVRDTILARHQFTLEVVAKWRRLKYFSNDLQAHDEWLDIALIGKIVGQHAWRLADVLGLQGQATL